MTPASTLSTPPRYRPTPAAKSRPSWLWAKRSPAPQPDTPRDARRIFDEALRHHIAGRLGDAVVGYERVLRINANHAEARNNLGVVLAAQGRLQDAVAQYNRALLLKPDYADACNNLAVALAAQGRIAEAIACYERALALNPANAAVHFNLAIALAEQGRIDDAAARYRHALQLKPGYHEAHNNLGNLLAEQNKHDEAIFHYRQALAIDPCNAEAQNNLGNVCRDQGKFADAVAHYDRAIAIQPGNAEAHYHRAEVKTFHSGDADLEELKRLADTASPYIHFALAKALEDCGDYERAFGHLRYGNDLKRTQIHYDERAVERQFERISALFNAALFDRLRGAGDPSETPIFVLGMPRSGSTMIEQMLASHPQIQTAGEWKGFPRAIPASLDTLDAVVLRQAAHTYLSGLPALAEGKLRTADKLPLNFLHIGLIRLMLPNARIIHTVRDPIDTCVSCYSKLFTSGQHFSYDMGELGRYYLRYRKLMAHWRSVLPLDAILDVSYEDVVDDIEGQARRMIDFCGLPWDGRCLDFHGSTRSIRTASSVQVRKPLFRSSIERWRNYQFGIGPLLRELMPGAMAASNRS
jgi:Flp pilus assembly protein TadD